MSVRGSRTAGELDALVGLWLDSFGSVNTRAAYGGDLAGFRQWCAGGGRLPLTATAEDLAAYFSWCEAAGATSATVARRMSALDSFFSFACRADVIGTNPTTAMDRPSIARTSSTAVLGDSEAAGLLRASDRLGAKTAALVRLLMVDGFRLGEVLAADAADFDAGAPKSALTLGRERRRSRTVALHPTTARRLVRYVGRRRRGPLLLSEAAGRDNDRLTRFGADYLLKQVADAAQVRTRVSANTLRRRYVSAAIQAGAHLADVRDRFGHRDARTTERYLDPEHDIPAPESGASKRR
jgi:site-specific recombinase XerD